MTFMEWQEETYGLPKTSDSDRKKRTRNTFKEYDHDRDGIITVEEFLRPVHDEL